jgi:uncharacterized membrane protein YfcA
MNNKVKALLGVVRFWIATIVLIVLSCLLFKYVPTDILKILSACFFVGIVFYMDYRIRLDIIKIESKLKNRSQDN